MSTEQSLPTCEGEVVLPCAELEQTLRFFTDTLGFLLDTIIPAEDPSVARLSGHGLHIRLQRGGGGSPGCLRLVCRDPGALASLDRALLAPNGTRVLLVDGAAGLVLPPPCPSLVVNQRQAAEPWKVGRAGMRYRDLIPGRQGGRFIASHIQIPEGGAVPDYVHYHKIRFQMIYCYQGWVKVVYEDQGAPFILRAGDCVLQPPEIRHRVLECSPGLEVIEVSCPASHETWADHTLDLPTSRLRPERNFGGQRFVRHQAAAATWQPWRLPGFAARDLGLEAATQGLAGAQVARLGASSAPEPQPWSHQGEFLFLFVLQGATTLEDAQAERWQLSRADSSVLPPNRPYILSHQTPDLELLELRLPA